MTVKLRCSIWVRCQIASVVWLKSDRKSDWSAPSNDASQFLTVSFGAKQIRINNNIRSLRNGVFGFHDLNGSVFQFAAISAGGLALSVCVMRLLGFVCLR